MSTLKADLVTAVTTNGALKVKGLGSGKVKLGDGELVWPDADGAAGTFITTNGSAVLSFATGSLPKNHVDGLILSNDTDADHDINVTAGQARDKADANDMVLASEQTKRLDASWATGNDAGGLSSSLTIANTTWYHCFIMEVSSTVEIGFDTSVTAANLIEDHSASKVRLVGSVLTNGSANILAFTQVSDEVAWDSAPTDYSVATTIVDTEQTFSIPLGYSVIARVGDILWHNGGTTMVGGVYGPGLTSGIIHYSLSSGRTSEGYSIASNNLSQLSVKANQNTLTNHYIYTQGWSYIRGEM